MKVMGVISRFEAFKTKYRGAVDKFHGIGIATLKLFNSRMEI